VGCGRLVGRGSRTSVSGGWHGGRGCGRRQVVRPDRPTGLPTDRCVHLVPWGERAGPAGDGLAGQLPAGYRQRNRAGRCGAGDDRTQDPAVGCRLMRGTGDRCVQNSRSVGCYRRIAAGGLPAHCAAGTRMWLRRTGFGCWARLDRYGPGRPGGWGHATAQHTGRRCEFRCGPCSCQSGTSLSGGLAGTGRTGTVHTGTGAPRGRANWGRGRSDHAGSGAGRCLSGPGRPHRTTGPDGGPQLLRAGQDGRQLAATNRRQSTAAHRGKHRCQCGKRRRLVPDWPAAAY